MKAPQTLDGAHTSQRSEVDTSFDLGGQPFHRGTVGTLVLSGGKF